MAMFNRSKLNFIKLSLLLIVLLTSTINIAQTKERIDIESKAKELGITTTELQGILNSALRTGGSDNPQLDSLANIILTGQAAYDYFGYSVSIAGDVNGDGYSDVIVGADENDAGGSDFGTTYIYYGGTLMDTIADVTMTGEASDDHFGISVSTAGDVNGDGFSDVIVGASHNAAGGTDAGRAYIYFGGATMDNIAEVIMTGEAAVNYFGKSVSTAGDVNGDGYSDVIVGAPYNDAGGDWAGRSYIYFGGVSMDNTADVIMNGEAAGDGFGAPVSTAGDVNGDGYSDVIVSDNSNDAGRSYIYFGGISMDNSADVIMTGEAAYDVFGFSVSTAGDVNGDGYSDVIVGAQHNNAWVGKAYLYFGGTSMDNIADVIMTGEAADDHFGISVSTAGDVNGDGYSDVIVGATGNDAGGNAAGRSYIYFGGVAMDNTPDVTMTGEAGYNEFGRSVSTAGDVNGDGYSDVIVGADRNDAVGTDAGRAYIYLSSIPSFPPWSNQIIVEDAGGTESSMVLTFGQHPDATDSLDSSLGELEAPPPPPPFNFDARFNLPTNPVVWTFIDFRDYSQTEITWEMGFQPGTEGYPMTFSWDSTSFPEGTFYLTDSINGSFVNVNMKLKSNYVLTNTDISSLNIIFDREGINPTTPLAPTNLSGVADTSAIELSWVDNSDNEAGFIIERKDGDSLSANPFIIIDTVATNQTVYTDTGLALNTTYTYRILAFNEFGSSDYSNLAQATTSELPIPQWSSQIIVENAEGTEASEVLTFGQHTDATDSIDTSLGEYILPPAPPSDIFDSRFILPTVPEFGSLIDLRDYSQTEITWTIAFQAGSAGYPMTFSWDNTSFPVGTFYLTDRITGTLVNVNMKEQSSYVLTISGFYALDINYNGERCSEVSVNNGWNMISVPYLAEDMALSSLFPTATSQAFGFEDYYVAKDILSTGEGYWLKFGGNENIQICGMPPRDTIQVNAEWNMIGPFEEDIPVSQITTTPPGIIASNFFGFEVGYNIADTLKSGKGYWVYVTSDGVINLNGVELAKGESEQIAQIEQDWGKIEITDSDGKGITLYAAAEEIESDFYNLPPMPPSGIFDARFNSGKLVETLNNEKIIQISSDNYPITIKAEGLSITVRDRINGKLLNEELNSGEEIRITNNKITSIEVSGRVTGGLPVSYELSQNYPNPFNPSTTIKFAVPKESNVNLSIYNVLGELVSTLVNEQKKAGYYEVEFNSSHYASGVYLYRITAGDFIETKKMVLLR